MISGFLDLLLMASIDELIAFIDELMALIDELVALLTNQWPYWPINGLIEGLMA